MERWPVTTQLSRAPFRLPDGLKSHSHIRPFRFRDHRLHRELKECHLQFLIGLIGLLMSSSYVVISGGQSAVWRSLSFRFFVGARHRRM